MNKSPKVIELEMKIGLKIKKINRYFFQNPSFFDTKKTINYSF
jgi:hypothetical protein